MKYFRLVAAIALIGVLMGCSGFSTSSLPTPLPDAYIPTAVALTLEAGRASQPVGATDPSIATSQPPLSTPTASNPAATSAPSLTPTQPVFDPAETPLQTPPSLNPSETAQPEIPVAAIQIFRPGDLSKIVSPLHVTGNLKPGADGKVRIELMGEDGRVLVRLIKVLYTLPGARASLSEDLEFQIAAVAEAGRLVISVADEAGRTVALNSVDLILLSMGEADINPASAVQESIVIQQPVSKALIQGGIVVVSGLARPKTGLPLMVQLVTEEGKVVGSRLAGVSPDPVSGYSTFAAEVPYTIEALTTVQLVVFEDGGTASPVSHLASKEILLSP